MKKLFAAAAALSFALASVVALADDKTPTPTPTPEEQAKMKADRAAAKEWKKNPDQKKAARAAKQREMAHIEKVGNPQIEGNDISKAAAATKSDAKALPTKEAKQKALTEQEKKSSGQ